MGLNKNDFEPPMDFLEDESLAGDKFKDECGIFGIWNHEEASRLVYLGLYAMQHRGQESAGIVSLDSRGEHSGRHFQHKGLGLVESVFSDAGLEGLRGRVAIGHVRYSTTGQNHLSNIQPLTAHLLNGPVAVAHNGNIVNSDPIRQKLKETGAIFQGSNDTEVLLHLLSRHPSDDLVIALKDSVKNLVGAYSLLILSHDRLVAIRDPFGFRPLVLGKKINEDGTSAVVLASETCAFDLIGATFVREIEPGEIFWVDENGEHSEKFIPSGADSLGATTRRAHCIFEHIYFSRPDSIVFGKSVYLSRKKFGEQLAAESPIDADLVVPVPDSGVPAALGYSAKSGIPFELGIIRNHYVGRTFIQPQQSIRDFGVKIKLNPQQAVLKGKRVIVIDDSLVRGTTSKKIINLIRAAGAKEVHMRIACPPTIGPCFYGVDTPQKSQLIAAQQKLEEIRTFIGADSLAYLTIPGMFKAIEDSSENYCAACFDGKYPTPLSPGGI